MIGSWRLDLKFTNRAIHLSPRRFDAKRTQFAMISSSYSFSSSSSIRFSLFFTTLFFDYENEDDDEDEKQSSIVSIHWWAITIVRTRIYTTYSLRLGAFALTNYSRIANALTGKDPMPLTGAGTAKNLNPAFGKKSRLHRCSTIGIPAPSKIVCAGRVPSVLSSIFRESMPTSAAPADFRYSADARVRKG